MYARGHNISFWLMPVLAAILLTGCERKADRPPLVIKAPDPDAFRQKQGWRTEPVVFNGKRYNVAWRQTVAGTYVVRISAPGRRLGATKGDERIMREVAGAAIRHFNCKSSQRARVGLTRAVRGRWELIVRCE